MRFFFQGNLVVPLTVFWEDRVESSLEEFGKLVVFFRYSLQPIGGVLLFFLLHNADKLFECWS